MIRALFVKCPYPEMIEAISFSGFDACILDMEHTPISQKDLYTLILAAERRDLMPIVRVPSQDEQYIKWALDLGVESIQIPHISGPEDIKKIQNFSYFKPIGDRGLCRFVRSAEFSNLNATEYIKKANSSTKIIYQIEGLNAINQISEIIDAIEIPSTIFLGPYDLSQAVDRPGEIWHEDVVNLMTKVIHDCRSNNIEVGTFTDTKDGINFWKEKGLSLVEYGSDLNLLIDASKKLLSE